MTIREFQDFIRRQYFARDSERGTPKTFLWFVEEVGELALALAGDDQHNKQEEFADVLAWLCTLASLAGISMEEASRKYANGCPACHKMPCDCSQKG